MSFTYLKYSLFLLGVTQRDGVKDLGRAQGVLKGTFEALHELGPGTAADLGRETRWPVSRRKTGCLLIAVSAAQAWLPEDANICLLNEGSLPSMRFGNERNHSVIGVIWSDFLEELSCRFHFSLSVLPLGGGEVLS